MKDKEGGPGRRDLVTNLKAPPSADLSQAAYSDWHSAAHSGKGRDTMLITFTLRMRLDCLDSN